MHPEFARWYHAAELARDEAILQGRWNAVATVAKSASWADVETLIRTVFGVRQSRPEGPTRVRDLLAGADASFEAEGNQREFQLLSAASLVAMFDAATLIGRAAAVAVSTASAAGTRKPIVPIDVNGYAKGAIVKQAESARDRKGVPKLADVAPIDFSAAGTKAKEGGENLATAYGLAAGTTTAALKALTQTVQVAINSLHRQLQLQDEELNMMWWLVGGRSWDLATVR